jgi:hypothetical protein
MATKSSKKGNNEEDYLIVSVNGLDIQANSLYIIEPKLDPSAPDGLVKLGTSKIPSEGIGNTVGCKFIDNGQGNGTGLYDTGFYPESACYKTTNDNEKKTTLESLNKYLVEPFEKLQNVHGVLEPSNFTFWDNLSISLYEGRVFNTANVMDLFELYVAVRSGDLTPSGKEGAPQFSGSDYVIKNNKQSMSTLQQRTLSRFEAISGFSTLLGTKEPDLINLLRFLGVIKTSLKPQKPELTTSFNIWLDKDVQNPDSFNRAYTKLNTEEGKEEIILTVQVKKLVERGTIKKQGQYLVYNNVELGMDSKSTVKALLENADLSDIKEEIRLS